jgi:Protein of unknown function (DUF1045)
VNDGPRYAIYFVPAAQSEFYGFGSAVLGYDCYTGNTVPHPDGFDRDTRPWERLTEEPRRYGFHATLKAPFFLRSSCTEAQLVSAIRSFAALGHPVPSIVPAIRMLGSFAAIVPSRSQPKIDALATSCTTIFDAFRAPMSPQERARRLASGLSQGQIENLDRWGYPFLFSEFRFHMTLTGRIPADRRKQVLVTLQQCFSRKCGDRPFAIDSLTLARQESADAAFRVLSQTPLHGAAFPS